jgi:hypothetical protein
MKIEKWAIQSKDGFYVALDKEGKAIFRKNVKQALLLDDKEDTLLYIGKHTPWKAKRLIFELVDKPNHNKPKIEKWVIQIVDAAKFYAGIRNWYVNYSTKGSVKYVKSIKKATLFDTKKDTVDFNSYMLEWPVNSDMLKWRAKKLTFELAE